MSSEAVLETYSLEEIFEYNDMTSEEVLDILVRYKILKLPEVKPLEFDE